jgi:uncharacterized FlaG/YvyC family protein
LLRNIPQEQAMTQPEMDSIRPIDTISSTDFSTSHESRAPAVTPRVTAAAKEPTRTVSPDDVVAAAVSAANSNLATYNRVMDFKVDSGTGISIAFIRNAQTGEVLQQIPSPDMVKLAQMLRDWSPGKNMMLDVTA